MALNVTTAGAALRFIPFLSFFVVAGVVLDVMGLVLFSFHPIFMSAAFLLFMAQGVMWYRIAHLAAGGVTVDVTLLRKGHAICQGSSAICALAGLIIIMVNKVKMMHPWLSFSTHACFGWLALLGILGQGAVGLFKVHMIENYGEKVFRWHGSSGLVVITLGVVAIVLGTHTILGASADQSKPISIYIAAFSCWATVMGVRLGLSFPPSQEDEEQQGFTGFNVMT